MQCPDCGGYGITAIDTKNRPIICHKCKGLGSIEAAVCGRCENCKWWTAPSSSLTEIHGLPEWGLCYCIEDEEDNVDDNIRAVIETSEMAWFRTKPDFGCVQFEAKE